MKFRNQFLKYTVMNEAADGSEGGSGGDAPQEQESKPADEPNGNSDAEEVKAQNAELLKEVMKKKGKIQELESKLNETLDKFKGVDLEQYQTLLEQQQTAEQERQRQEEERLKSEGKFEELLEAKRLEHESILEQVKTQHTEQFKTVEQKLAEYETQNQTLQGQIEELTVGSAFGNSQLIRNDLISAFTPERVRALYGSHFESNERGEVVGYDKPRGVEGRAPIVDSQGKPVDFDSALKAILSTQGDMDSMLRNKVQGAGSGSANDARATSDGGSSIGKGIERITHALNAS